MKRLSKAFLKSKSKKKVEEESRKAADQVAIGEKEWYLRWEYDELPPKRSSGIIFSPCLKQRQRYPEELTFSRLTRSYSVYNDGKVLIGEIEPCVFAHGQIALDTLDAVPWVCLHLICKPLNVMILDLKMTGELQHRNLLQALGWCEDRDSHVFSAVHEQANKGPLFSHIHFPSLTGALPWEHRYKIACGLAEAIYYLHEGAEETTFHMEINSHNVLLDSDYNAKLMNLGAFRFKSGSGNVTVLLAGTSGLKALEPVGEKHSHEANVRSFGLLVLEIACGLDPTSTTSETTSIWHHAMDFYVRGALLAGVDPVLEENFNEKRMERLMLVGLWCAQPDPASRPSIKQAVRYLAFEASLPTQLPSVSMQAFLTTRAASNVDRPIPARRGIADDDLDFQFPTQRGESSGGATARNVDAESMMEQLTGNPLLLSIAILSGLVIPDQGSSTIQGDDTEKKTSVVLKELSRSSSNLSPVAREDTEEEEEEEEDKPASPPPEPPSDEVFDIGIPSNYKNSSAPLKGFQADLVKGVISDFRQNLEDGLEFEKVLELVRSYTKALVTMGIPMGNWNSLVQDVLHAARSVDRFREESDSGGTTGRDFSDLRQDMDQCTRNIEKADEEIGMLLVKNVELQRKLAGLQREIKAAEEEATLAAERKAREMRTLESRRKELDLFQLVQSVGSKVALFSCHE